MRSEDQEPLSRATQLDSPVLALFIFEPLYRKHPDFAWRHWQFQYHSALEIRRKLAELGIEMLLLHGEAVPIFDFIFRAASTDKLYSYRETGVKASYERDIALRKLCKERGVKWYEYDKNGVQRGLKNRQQWDENWRDYMNQPLMPAPPAREALHLNFTNELQRQFALPPELITRLKNFPSTFQKAGEAAAHKRMNLFLQEKVANYQRYISKPELSREYCSRLSVYLAWGNLSLRQVYQSASDLYRNTENKFALRSFLSRLHWHSHFVQKFEMEERMEFENINRGFDALDRKVQTDLLEAWKKGETGIPLIDAAMAALRESGYLNFRMRAMLVSFLSHHLWQPWQAGVHHLAQLFLDYLPGIHYPQFQMQSAVTGINAVRVYNPVKQSLDHDPQGRFIARYLPQLAQLPDEFIHQPWLLSEMEQTMYNFKLGRDYPKPVIEHLSAATDARQKLHAAKKWPLVQLENRRILAKHTTADRNIDRRSAKIIASKNQSQ